MHCSSRTLRFFGRSIASDLGNRRQGHCCPVPGSREYVVVRSDRYVHKSLPDGVWRWAQP